MKLQYTDAQEFCFSKDLEKYEVLYEHEIKKFMDNNLDTILKEIAKDLTVTDEQDISPQNHLVNPSSFFYHSEGAILGYITEELKESCDNYSPKLLYDTLYDHFLLKVVSKTLHKRNEILMQKQKAREDRLVQNCLDHVEKNLIDGIKEDYSSFGVLDKVIKVIINSSDIEDVKNVLSYPVVRDEISTYIRKKEDSTDQKAVRLAIAPSILEGIQKWEKRNEKEQVTESAVISVSNALLKPIEMSIRNRLKTARRYLDYVNRLIIYNPQAQIDFHDYAAVYWRRTITFLLYRNPSLYHNYPVYEFELDHGKKVSVPKRILKTTRKLTGMDLQLFAHDYIMRLVQPNVEILNREMYMELSQIKVQQKAVNVLLTNLPAAAIDTYDAYIGLQQRFTEVHRSTLVNIAKEMLKTKHKDLKVADFESISDSIEELELVLGNNNTPLYNPLQLFNDELENHAISLFGFTKGSFTYSIAYLSVMQTLFPSLANPFSDDQNTLDIKYEL